MGRNNAPSNTCLLARKYPIPASFLKIRLLLTFYREHLLPSFAPFYSPLGSAFCVLPVTKPRAFPLLNVPGSLWLHTSLGHIALHTSLQDGIQQELSEPGRKSRASRQLSVFKYIFIALAHLTQANMRPKGLIMCVSHLFLLYCCIMILFCKKNKGNLCGFGQNKCCLCASIPMILR